MPENLTQIDKLKKQREQLNARIEKMEAAEKRALKNKIPAAKF